MNWPQWDTQLFLKINGEWTSQTADWFFSNVTDLHKNNLFVVVLLATLATVFFFLRKRGLRFLVGLILSLGLSDAISYHLIKKTVQRHRPALSLSEVRVLSPFAGTLSFPSNHAANTMAAAVFISLFWGFKVGLPFFLWAMVISYSRVYVGVHYPLDVFFGMIVGALVAILIFSSQNFLKIFKRENARE